MIIARFRLIWLYLGEGVQEGGLMGATNLETFYVSKCYLLLRRLGFGVVGLVA